MNSDPGPWGVILGLLMFGAIVLIAWVFKKGKREPVMRWIPIGERLPREKEIVDVFYKGIGRFTNTIFLRDESREYFFENKVRLNVSEITHWMKVPPPEEETRDI